MHPSPAQGKWQEVTARAVRKEGKRTLTGRLKPPALVRVPCPLEPAPVGNKQHTRTRAPRHLAQRWEHPVLTRAVRQGISDIKICISHKKQQCFLAQSPKAIEGKAKQNKWDLVQLTRLHSEGNHQQNGKTNPRVWEKVFANDSANKSLLSKMYK